MLEHRDKETRRHGNMEILLHVFQFKVPASPRLRVPLSRNASLRPRVWEGVTLKRILSFHRAPFLLVRPVQGWH
jgi:hypothetical protein